MAISAPDGANYRMHLLCFFFLIFSSFAFLAVPGSLHLLTLSLTQLVTFDWMRMRRQKEEIRKQFSRDIWRNWQSKYLFEKKSFLCMGCLKLMPMAMIMICRKFISQTSNSSGSGYRRAREEPKKKENHLKTISKMMGTLVQVQLYTFSFRMALYQPQKLPKITGWG